ncbi:MAG: DNA methyltransferase [Desulfobacterales bacterium]|nr:DNA methyltransferase [Desulfobacterales bacterium]
MSQQELPGFNQKPETRNQEPVECLGMTFDNDEARREHFLGILREKLKDPEFRKIEGFPIGEDKDILALSDPPYYTACPNPFIGDFIKHYGKPYDPETDNYKREPFAADVSEGKNDPIYNAHSYHTKVPHKAIMRYILHYTEPGDIVFDGFCGTGMTGVAAQMCGDRETVVSLGFQVKPDGTILQKETDEDGKNGWVAFSKLGSRRAILNDLSPAATFIAYNYNTPVDVCEFEREAKRIIEEVEDECGWMYETKHNDGNSLGKIDYVIYSDNYYCPSCSKELVLWDIAYDKATKMKLGSELNCDKCGVEISKRELKRVSVTKYDHYLKKSIKLQKRTPVLIVYKIMGRSYEKLPDLYDLNLLRKIEDITVCDWFPICRLPLGDKTRDAYNAGIEYVHHFFHRRALIMLSSLWNKALSSKSSKSLLFCIQSIVLSFTYLNRFFAASYSQVNRYLKGTIYVSPLIAEISPWYGLQGKIKRFLNVFTYSSNVAATATNSLTQFDSLPSNTLDYIFTDPPFGSNIMYSELNFIWESWIKVITNNMDEAIQNITQNKSLFEYQSLMFKCFTEYYRVLKPSRWMTVEFHNSKNSVWIAIQESLQKAGFVVADVRTIDKQQNTMNQMTSSGAVKRDLVISAYKPNGGLENRFNLTAGTEEGVWDFIRTHLKQLPVFVSKDGKAEVIVERQHFLLFDRMVAFHVQRGVTVPLSAAEFYAGLEQRFPPRDGMYFLPDQAAEYDKKRMTVKEVLQLQLFVSDEASAIQWLKQQLTRKPQTFQEIHPQFMKELGGWQKHEKALELSELLKENFLAYDGKGSIPAQIISWMKQSARLRELISCESSVAGHVSNNQELGTRNPELLRAAKDRWYVPDPNKAGDLEKLRERSLLKEFHEYLESQQKRLKVFRLEAVRAGFKKAWQEKDYTTIIEVAQKIKEEVLQEDPKLLMFYDQALTRADHS